MEQEQIVVVTASRPVLERVSPPETRLPPERVAKNRNHVLGFFEFKEWKLVSGTNSSTLKQEFADLPNQEQSYSKCLGVPHYIAMVEPILNELTNHLPHWDAAEKRL